MSHHFRIFAAVSLAIAFAAPVQAVSMGEMHAVSALGEPLRLELELVDLQGSPLSEIKLAPAAAADYARLGISMPMPVLTLSFEVITDANNRVYAVVKSREAQTTAHVNLLLQISVLGSVRLQQVEVVLGRALPAVTNSPHLASAMPTVNEAEPQAAVVDTNAADTSATMPTSATATADASAPVAITATPVATVTAGNGANAGAKPAAEATAGANIERFLDAPQRGSTQTQTSNQQRVESGETLSSVASAWSVSTLSLAQKQQLLAQANPHAFIARDINRLRAGAVLKVPSEAVPIAPTGAAARAWLSAQLKGGKLDANTSSQQPPSAANVTNSTTLKAIGKLDQPVITSAGSTKSPIVGSDVRLTLLAAGGTAAHAGAGDNAKVAGLSMQRELAQADAAEKALLTEREALLASIKSAGTHQAEQDARLKLLDERLAAFDERSVVSAQKAAAPQHTLSQRAMRWLQAPYRVALLALGLLFLLVLLFLLPARWRRAQPPLAPLMRKEPDVAMPVLNAEALAVMAADHRHDSSAIGMDAHEHKLDAEGFDELPEISNETLLAADHDEYDILSASETEAHQTRLDLAQAYIDMGEQASARDLLLVVQAQGTPNQRHSASALLQTLS